MRGVGRGPLVQPLPRLKRVLPIDERLPLLHPRLAGRAPVLQRVPELLGVAPVLVLHESPSAHVAPARTSAARQRLTRMVLQRVRVCLGPCVTSAAPKAPALTCGAPSSTHRCTASALGAVWTRAPWAPRLARLRQAGGGRAGAEMASAPRPDAASDPQTRQTSPSTDFEQFILATIWGELVAGINPDLTPV